METDLRARLVVWLIHVPNKRKLVWSLIPHIARLVRYWVCRSAVRVAARVCGGEADSEAGVLTRPLYLLGPHLLWRRLCPRLLLQMAK